MRCDAMTRQTKVWIGNCGVEVHAGIHSRNIEMQLGGDVLTPAGLVAVVMRT